MQGLNVGSTNTTECNFQRDVFVAAQWFLNIANFDIPITFRVFDKSLQLAVNLRGGILQCIAYSWQ